LSSRGENGSTRLSAVTGQRPAVLGVFFFLKKNVATFWKAGRRLNRKLWLWRARVEKLWAHGLARRVVIGLYLLASGPYHYFAYCSQRDLSANKKNVTSPTSKPWFPRTGGSPPNSYVRPDKKKKPWFLFWKRIHNIWSFFCMPKVKVIGSNVKPCHTII
jgi:hypothetical protein